MVPFTASSDSDAPNCNYIINGTFKAIAISSVRATVEELSSKRPGAQSDLHKHRRAASTATAASIATAATWG